MELARTTLVQAMKDGAHGGLLLISDLSLSSCIGSTVILDLGDNCPDFTTSIAEHPVYQVRGADLAFKTSNNLVVELPSACFI